MRKYTLQYLTHSDPPEKHLKMIRNFPGMVIIREETYEKYNRMHSFRFEHENNDLTMNMFKLGSPWYLFRGPRGVIKKD